MNLVEAIVFFITMLLMFFLFARKAKEEKYRAEHPEEFEARRSGEEEAMREFLQALDIDFDEPVPRPAPPPPEKIKESRPRTKKPKPTLMPKSQDVLGGLVSDDRFIEPHFQKPAAFWDMNSFHDSAYEMKQTKSSSAHSLLRALKSKKEMIVLREIIGPPKSRNDRG